ncbi:BTB/POZ domain-containing protein [Apostasia shenzhenica]|uniref:BTB/POZ domain-containing protein n=1 Tax=Apostasia shenzhenica TaxID=1088818 RepID=A0A2I0ADM3_9ASPA|nr:BTB/POZ domain-containing protein [Apostasia shenzhenica]
MSGSFLRCGGLKAWELLCRFPVRLDPAAQRPRAYVRSTPAAAKFNQDSAARLSPAASSALASSVASRSSRSGFVSWYLGMIEARPVLTKSVTAGAIFSVADISSQMITLSTFDSLDWIRTLRMGSYGLLISGPSLHLWFNFVSRILPKRDVINTLKKMFLGQAMYGPIMTAVFFSVNAGLKGESAAEIFARLKRDLIPTLKSGIVYWPMCDFITFKFFPVRLQPLVSNSFSFLWTIYITYMASLQKPTVHQLISFSLHSAADLSAELVKQPSQRDEERGERREMAGSFLRSGGIRARELLCRVSPAPAAQRPRAYVRLTPGTTKFIGDSAARVPPVASSALASSVASRSGLVGWYLGMIEARPVLTKGVTAGAIFSSADISSQMITLSAFDSLDWIRTLRMGSYGMLIAGPSLHLWFCFVSKILPKTDIINTLKKIFLGQTTYGPIMTAVFFSVNAGVQGESAAEISARLKRDLIPTFLRGLVYWPMCDFITFKFFPVRLQLFIHRQKIEISKESKLLFKLCRSPDQLILAQETPSDITVYAAGSSFSLHKFPLVSKCGLIKKLLSEPNIQNPSSIEIPDIPGGSEAFELAAKFCYGINFEINTDNIAILCCASEFLEMTEELADGNLLRRTESYLEEVLFTSLSSSIAVLHKSEELLPMTEKVKLVSRLIDAIAYLACKSSYETLSSKDWWAAELTVLRIETFQRVLMAMKARGFKQLALGPVVMLYAQKSLRGLDVFGRGRKKIEPREEHEKRVILETVAHPSLNDTERKKLCSLMDCRRLSREACAHAAQNDRLPVQTVVQVLYFEQQRIRESSFAGSFMSGGDSPAPSNKSCSFGPSYYAGADELLQLKRENDSLKLELAKMKMLLKEKEKASGPVASVSAGKPPLPRKSFMNSVSKKIGRLYPFMRSESDNKSLLEKGKMKPPKNRRHSIS